MPPTYPAKCAYVEPKSGGVYPKPLIGGPPDGYAPRGVRDCHLRLHVRQGLARAYLSPLN